MQYRFSDYHVASDILPSAEREQPRRLIYATRTGRTALLLDEIYQKLKRGDFQNLSTSSLMNLFDLELIVPEGENEFQTILGRNRAGLTNEKTLNVVIQPTANCQLGCNYCGQTHRKTSMPDDLTRKITDRVSFNLLKGKYERLDVEWYGAEPLMAYSKILKMSDRLISVCEKAGVDYSAHMITNGLSFKPEVFRQLLARKCTNFQITLDGTARTHDSLRMTKTGRATFDTILSNIIAVSSLPEFVENGCGIIVRMNVNRVSSQEVPQLLELLSSHGLQHRNVGVDFQQVTDWGGNGASETSHGASDYAEMEIEWMLMALKMGFHIAPILPGRQIKPCMVVEPDGEVYDADGNVFACYELPYTAAYEGPEYQLGKVDTIYSDYNEQAFTRTWYSDIEKNVSPCPQCSLFPVCGGGCPKKWLRDEGTCPSFKYNMQDRLALNYLVEHRDFIKTLRASDTLAEEIGQ